ncbi:hypothetical protein SAMN05660359_01408 [Geodermatophilus obscurus]|uniref:Uncharacterized protein n=1 Tax=Geodermatophilus obscurus TaxID=1861 RepID=A0A1I5EGF8_9ACTN|nr:hypothetical protein [Geodermatophilus obscurus]SFO10376.1 hypothetical protein SAMN05660359_01408 [Geodermatophilus obscurus]
MTLDGTLRWLFAVVAAAMLTAFAVLLVTGEYHNEGPVLLRVAHGHGIHRGDVFVLTGWAAGLLSLSGLLWGRRR